MSEASYLADMVANLKPRLVVELGTGDGAMAARVMEVLPPGGRLICVNWPNPPSGDDPKRYLEPHLHDKRLSVVYGDTRDEFISVMIPNDIDILHIDSTHTSECAFDEWWLYEPKMAVESTVVVDDLNHNDMMKFWDTLLGDKVVLYNGRVGVLKYRRKHA